MEPLLTKDFPEHDDETWTRHTHCLGWTGLTCFLGLLRSRFADDGDNDVDDEVDDDDGQALSRAL